MGRWLALGLFAVALPAAKAALIYLAGHANHDVAWLLVAAERLFDGGRYYHDILEPNPPVTLAVMAPGLVIDDLLDIATYPAYLAWVVALIALSSLLTWRSLPRALGRGPSDPLPEAWLVPAALCLFPWYGFGQREHLFVILYLPALAMFQAECRGPGRTRAAFAVPVMALATFGLLMKPYWLLIPAAQVALALVDGRPVRRFVLLAAPTATAVVAVLASLNWSLLHEWLSVVPLATAVYDAYDDPLWLPKLLPHAAMIALVWAAHRYMVRDRLSTAVVVRDTLAAAAAALVVVFLQRKAFPYHLLPTIQLTALAAGVVLLRLLSDGVALRRPAVTPRAAVALVCAGLVFQAAPVLYRAFRPVPAEERELIALAAGPAAGRPFLAVSTSVWPAFPMALDSGAQWVGRVGCQWMIPGALRLSQGASDGDRAQGAHYAGIALAMLAEDIARGRPAVLAVAIGADGQGLDGPFDLLAYLRSHDGLRGELDAYRERARGAYWAVYDRVSPG
ncbi:MAG: hypothetical protein AB7K86_06305 [Rhodospirillales bacterium]